MLTLIRNVMNHMSHHFNLFEATHFVLSGTSAGGFGVKHHVFTVMKMVIAILMMRLSGTSAGGFGVTMIFVTMVIRLVDVFLWELRLDDVQNDHNGILKHSLPASVLTSLFATVTIIVIIIMIMIVIIAAIIIHPQLISGWTQLR